MRCCAHADGGMGDLPRAASASPASPKTMAPRRFRSRGPSGCSTSAPNSAHDLGERGLARHHHLAGEEIGVDHLRAEVGEHLAHRALAGGDAAGEADEEEAPHACGPVGAGLDVDLERHVERRARTPSPRRRGPPARGSSPSGTSKSSSSCTCSSMRLSSRVRASSRAIADHRDLDQIGGGALDRRVGRHALAEAAEVRIAAPQLGEVAPAAEQRLT